MLRAAVIFFLLLSIPILAAADERQAVLHFFPNNPVRHHLELQYTKKTSIKGQQPIVAQGIQQIDAVVTILEEQKEELPDPHAVELMVLLERFLNKSEHQGSTITFDSQRPQTSLEMAQLSKLVDRPFKFFYTQENGLQENAGYQNVLINLPALKDLGILSVVKDHIQEMFSLADKKLTLGEKYTIKKTHPRYVQEYVYTIKEITGQQVVCDIMAKVQRTKFNIEFNSKAMVGVVSGQWQGTGTWNLEQGLEFQQAMAGDLTMSLKLGDQEIVNTLDFSFRSTCEREAL